jgi:ketosteroid isomerase-like protein
MHLFAALLAAIVTIACPGTGRADDAADIRAALEQWRADFNARNRDSICGLFAEDVVADVQGVPPRDFVKVCDTLQETLADPTRTMSYALDIKELIVVGELAVVRLDWTLTVEPGGTTTMERGMDVFRRQPDGTWRIVRFMVHEVP